MTSLRRRTASAALGLMTAGTATAAPKKPAPAPPAVVKVLPQVQLRVNPVATKVVAVLVPVV